MYLLPPPTAGIPADQLFGPGLSFARQAVQGIGSRLGERVSSTSSLRGARSSRLPRNRASSSDSGSIEEESHMSDSHAGASSGVQWEGVPAGSVSRVPPADVQRVPVAV